MKLFNLSSTSIYFCSTIFALASGGSNVGKGALIKCTKSLDYNNMSNCKLADFISWGVTSRDTQETMDFDASEYNPRDGKHGFYKTDLFKTSTRFFDERGRPLSDKYQNPKLIEFRPWGMAGSPETKPDSTPSYFELVNSSPFGNRTGVSLSVIDTQNLDRYRAMVKRFKLEPEEGYCMPGRRFALPSDYFYGYTLGCDIPIIILNRLYAISKVEPKLSKLIEKHLLTLEWIFLPYSLDGSLSSLENTEDLGESPLSKKGFVTLAARTGNIVRIDTYHKHKSEFDSQVAMYTHEAIYAATEAQGDVDSARAGRINALIWKNDPSGDSIREAWELLLDEHASGSKNKNGPNG